MAVTTFGIIDFFLYLRGFICIIPSIIAIVVKTVRKMAMMMMILHLQSRRWYLSLAIYHFTGCKGRRHFVVAADFNQANDSSTDPSSLSKSNKRKCKSIHRQRFRCEKINKECNLNAIKMGKTVDIFFKLNSKFSTNLFCNLIFFFLCQLIKTFAFLIHLNSKQLYTYSFGHNNLNSIR